MGTTITRFRFQIFLLVLFASLPNVKAAASTVPGGKLFLREGWTLESSCKVAETGARISTTKFRPENWHRASVPSTVLGSLVADKIYPDPYFGMNLREIPGTDYPIGANFANLTMSSTSPFHCPWWYRKEFRLPSNLRNRRVWLHLDGVNFRANVWLNGRQVANSSDIAGTWRMYELNITTAVERDGANVIAIEVFPPAENDLAITWVDWNPMPPDKNMGLFKPVYLTHSGPVEIRHPFVASHLSPNLKIATLTVTAELLNTTDRPIQGTLTASWNGISSHQQVRLAPSESRLAKFSSDRFHPLKILRPRLWWPYPMGPQNLYSMKLSFETSGKVSDSQTVHFGVREITSELTDAGARLFRINGKKLLIRGGGWAPDMMWRQSHKRLEAELEYVRHLNLNTVRLEGKIESDEFFDLTDRYGILVMAGWCCCDIWEEWEKWNSEHRKIAVSSLKDQITRLRTHPSLLVWLNGSDGPPPADVERSYLDVLRSEQWPNPILSSASGSSTTVTGATGVKMTGPYDYVPPSYWLADKSRGGAFGFNTETSPGPAIPTKESLRRMLPPEHLWPIDAFWNYHSGGSVFANMDIFNKSLEERYGKFGNMEDYSMKSQAMAYEGERAMFEAYAGNKYAATGVIQWMLNNAWPSTIWHLYDYYLVPGGGYFGTRKACEAVHIQYSYDDRSIVVVNGLDRSLEHLKASAKIYNLNATGKFSRDVLFDAPADSSTRLFTLPELEGLTTTYFLKLTLEEKSGRKLSDNFYWLSTKSDTLDWKKSRWYYTPQSAYADFKDLNSLPPVKLKVTVTVHPNGSRATMRAVVTNPGKSIAFMVHLRLAKGKGGEDAAPVLWNDNYVTLLPGETRKIECAYRNENLGGRSPALEVDGWNVVPYSAALKIRRHSN